MIIKLDGKKLVEFFFLLDDNDDDAGGGARNRLRIFAPTSMVLTI